MNARMWLPARLCPVERFPTQIVVVKSMQNKLLEDRPLGKQPTFESVIQSLIDLTNTYHGKIK